MSPPYELVSQDRRFGASFDPGIGPTVAKGCSDQAALGAADDAPPSLEPFTVPRLPRPPVSCSELPQRTFQSDVPRLPSLEGTRPRRGPRPPFLDGTGHPRALAATVQAASSRPGHAEGVGVAEESSRQLRPLRRLSGRGSHGVTQPTGFGQSSLPNFGQPGKTRAFSEASNAAFSRGSASSASGIASPSGTLSWAIPLLRKLGTVGRQVRCEFCGHLPEACART